MAEEDLILDKVGECVCVCVRREGELQKEKSNRAPDVTGRWVFENSLDPGENLERQGVQNSCLSGMGRSAHVKKNKVA